MKTSTLTKAGLIRYLTVILILCFAVAIVGYVELTTVSGDAKDIASAEDAVTQVLIADMYHEGVLGSVEAGYHAVLVGESLVTSGDPRGGVAALRAAG